MSDAMVFVLATLAAAVDLIMQRRNTSGVLSVDMKLNRAEFIINAETGKVYREVGHANASGYVLVHDRREDGTRCDRYVHRLVWESVHGPIPTGMTINHINGIKSDNRIANLELATASEQLSHAYAAGLRERGIYGERNANAKLTAAIVREARRTFTGARGEIIALARQHGVSGNTMERALKGITWSRA